jgi:Protein of unknown function DUF262
MIMRSEHREIDKIYKRRNRYEIPDWQRGEVWDRPKKQALIDSILRGWKIPKFYFVKTSADQYQVEDGQQRLTAIFEFCSNELPLTSQSAKLFGGALYRDLPQDISDKFDDFEIDYDVIEDATDEELKDFFQRLQAGLPLTSSERLNAIHSKLRDYCRTISKQHPFFTEIIAIPDTRYSHFDITAKVVTIEIEGLESGLRFDDIKDVFESQANFSQTSAIAKRVRTALDFLHTAFKEDGAVLRTRTVIQSLINLTCKLISTGRYAGLEPQMRTFFEVFSKGLGRQIEMGQAASDSDYLMFQRSVNANVKEGAKTRHEILLRKLLRLSPVLADVFDPSIVAESGASGRIPELADSISELINQLNKRYAAKNGEDLFKATNKTAQALVRIRRVAKNLEQYKPFIDDLYFLFRESLGSRFGNQWPDSFTDINDLRTDLRHDVDHGKPSKVRAKRRKIAGAFEKYAGASTAETIEPAKFPLVQSNILSAIEGDLRNLLAKSA